mmetsp:Transcript_19890/g.25615  ORF Transcript_19890/g.25615 Transcript_19890/m.25615 type:complete len:238 (+) Transcript_19890:94-807(+)
MSSSRETSDGKFPDNWKGPIRPPSPSNVAKDISCQGVLAATLHEAMLELEGRVLIDANATAKSCAKSTSGDRGHADQELLANTKDDGSSSTQENADDHANIGHSGILVDKEFGTSVTNAFGHAVVKSQNDMFNASSSNDTLEKIMHQLPPPVVLRGRVDSYNRHGGKWRFLLKDATFRARKPLPRNRPRLSNCRQSLWSYCKNDQQTDRHVETDTADTGDAFCCSQLEILAYNDNDE